VTTAYFEDWIEAHKARVDAGARALGL